MTEINTYTIECTHPDLTGPLVVELIATSEAAAISRTRLIAFHMYRDARLLDAEYRVTGRKDGIWPDRPEKRQGHEIAQPTPEETL